MSINRDNAIIQCFFDAGDGRRTILIVYIDDIIMIGNNLKEIERLKKNLSLKIQIRYFLRMEVARSEKGNSASLRKYILDLFIERGMLRCKPSDIPIVIGKKKEDVAKLVDKDRYQKLVENLYICLAQGLIFVSKRSSLESCVYNSQASQRVTRQREVFQE